MRFHQKVLIDNMENEIWKDVVGYENRFVGSNKGNVKRKDTNGWVEKALTNGDSIKDDPENAYKQIKFSENGDTKYGGLVHRRVAEAFLKDHPVERNEVDHKDENK